MPESLMDQFQVALPAWRVTLMQAMREVELEEAREREIRNLQAKRRSVRARAVARRQNALARKAEAAAASKRASAAYQRFLKRQGLIRMAQKKEQAEALMHDVTVEETGGVDMKRDILWVYQNIGRLFHVTDKGIRILDEDVLAEAPSNGAIALANYACDDQKAFFDRFVIKLIPKDVSEPEDDDTQTDEELQRELDPGLEDMREFWNMDVAQ